VFITKKLRQDQLQSILDSYSVGKIVKIAFLSDVVVDSEKKINLFRCLAETDQGLYIIAFATNDELYGLWWRSNSKDFVATLTKVLKLKNAKILLTNQNTITVHKFDLRISVFAL
jgi:hypothetical protein